MAWDADRSAVYRPAGSRLDTLPPGGGCRLGGPAANRHAERKKLKMKNPKQLLRESLERPMRGSVAAGVAALTSLLASAAVLWALPAAALAASQPLLPFRCFAQVGVDHVVFGPDSFFLPNTVQGPTSFRENAGPTTVTYPLYHGTSQGRDVSYVITDASNLSVALALG